MNGRYYFLWQYLLLSWTYPEIEYFETTGDEGQRTTSLKKAGRYLDDDVLPYFVVTCPATYPVNPNPIFTSFTFPSTYSKVHKHGTIEDVACLLECAYFIDKTYVTAAASSKDFFTPLNDFHFLLWVWRHLQGEGKSELAQKLVQRVQGEVQYDSEVRKALEEMVGHTKDALKPKPTSVADPSMQQIMEMGYSEHLAREALAVSGGSLEAAINYLLSDMH